MKKSIFILISILLCFAFGISNYSKHSKPVNKSKQTRETWTITGTVTTAEEGDPLPGVNVMIKGTQQGTITDLDGNYRIDVVDSNNVLVFSFIGFESQEITIDNQTVIDVALIEDRVSLEEVVVVGYGTVKKSSLTGSVASVSAEELKMPTPKTWKRSNKSVNAVRLSVGDNEDDTLMLIGTEMKVQVDGFRARVLSNYYFYSEDDNYEGTFKIRMPTGASPYYFAFGPTEYLNKEDDEYVSFENFYDIDIYDYYEGDSLQLIHSKILDTKSEQWKQPKEAKVVPLQKAAYAYTETVRGQTDPMLAEWGGADVFNCRVFPIEGYHVHRVVIGYDVNLTSINNDKVFNLNIPKSSSATSIDLTVKKLTNARTSVSYKKGLTEDDTYYKLSIESPDSSNIEVRYAQTGNILLTDENKDYFASSFTLDLPKNERKSKAKDAVFAIDVSASSNPDKFNVWLKLLKSTLNNNQQSIKRFNVLFFNIETFWYQQNYVKNTPENVNQLMEFCNQLSLEGATDIGTAVNEFCNPSWAKNKSEKNIFLMSDASVTWGKEELYSISSGIGKKSIIYVYNTGISGTDMNVLAHLARESGGSLFSVTGEDEIEAASKAFNYEAWAVLSVKLAGCSDLLIQGRPKYIFPGQKIIVCGRSVPSKDAVLGLTLENGGKKQNLKLGFDHTIVSNLTKRVYGQVAVNQIESFDFLATKYAVPYAMHFKVPAKSCSMLMLESEEDYKEYNIELEKKSEVVKNSTVGKILSDLYKEVENSKGLEKDKLISQLEKLSKADGVDFEFSDTLRKIIEKTPAKYFRIEPSSFRCKNHFKQALSDTLLLELAKETPQFGLIESEADSLFKKFGKYDALKMLSTIVERNPNDGVLLQDVAFSAMRLGLSEHAYYLFKKVTEKRPHQPHAYLALAQILNDMGNNDLARIYYEIAYTAKWDRRFEDIKAVVGLDYLRFLKKVKKQRAHLRSKKIAKKRIVNLKSYLTSDEVDMDLDLDSIGLMISMVWNTDKTDFDLYVTEPTGEECSYSHTRTKAGGWISNDATEGYGPELYMSPFREKGKYKISVDYYADDDSRASTHSQVYLVIYENWGKKNEKVTRKVVSLKKEKEGQDVMEIDVD
jgi:hypothetical protein